MAASRQRYYPALDGVRALAIGLVLVCHSIPKTEGGGLGVNVFFTLSGFLITGLLLDEIERRGGIWMGGFYGRRALRLIPALLLFLAFVAVLPNVYGQPLTYWPAALAALLYVFNYAAAYGHIFEPYMAHLWSLSVEEQFYLLWPVSLLFLARRGALRQALPWLIAAFALSRAGLELTGGPSGVGWLWSNADQLLTGALAAVWFREGRHADLAKRPLVGWGALAVVAVLVLWGSKTHQGASSTFATYGGLTVVGIAGAALILHLAESASGPLHRLFTFTLFVWIGRVSYGIYLFHFPIFQWTQHRHWPFAKTFALEYTLTALVVAGSWLLVEQPALRLKRRFSSHARLSSLPPEPAVVRTAEQSAAD